MYYLVNNFYDIYFHFGFAKFYICLFVSSNTFRTVRFSSSEGISLFSTLHLREKGKKKTTRSDACQILLDHISKKRDSHVRDCAFILCINFPRVFEGVRHNHHKFSTRKIDNSFLRTSMCTKSASAFKLLD